MSRDYDGIILGAGHNGLVLQAYLGKAGLRTLAVERGPVAGGGLSTLEDPRHPGFLHNTHAFFQRAITTMPWYLDLELDRHGVRFIEPELNVALLTGDDFNYAELIAGDALGHSDALLGIFDAIAPAAAAALGALTRGDRDTFHDILAPTVPLSRHIFKAPTRFYKTGVVFMAYLNGLQDHFTMVGGQESARSTLHLAELFRLADAAGLIADPERAVARMRIVLATRGVAA
jgi:phytoene dehydrogenase-like protein